MIDYNVACVVFGKEVVDDLHLSVKYRANVQVVTDGAVILICSSVGTCVPACYERVEGLPLGREQLSHLDGYVKGERPFNCV